MEVCGFFLSIRLIEVVIVRIWSLIYLYSKNLVEIYLVDIYI